MRSFGGQRSHNGVGMCDCTQIAPMDYILATPPFLQVIEGCVCVNPGHLTKKASGGTFAKILVSKQLQVEEDMSSDIGVQIVHI